MAPSALSRFVMPQISLKSCLNLFCQVRITGSSAVYPSTTTVPSDEENTTTPAPLQPMYYVGNFQLDSAGQAGLYRVCYCSSALMRRSNS